MRNALIFIGAFWGGGVFAAPPSFPVSELRILARTSPIGSFAIRSVFSGIRCRFEGDALVLEDVRVELETLDSGIGLRDRIMKDQYFETKSFPYAYLRRVRAEKGAFTAELSIREHPTPVAGSFETKDGSVEARFRTRLSAFGIREPRYMGIGVRDDVEVVVRSEECTR